MMLLLAATAMTAAGVKIELPNRIISFLGHWIRRCRRTISWRPLRATSFCCCFGEADNLTVSRSSPCKPISEHTFPRKLPPNLKTRFASAAGCWPTRASPNQAK